MNGWLKHAANIAAGLASWLMTLQAILIHNPGFNIWFAAITGCSTFVAYHIYRSERTQSWGLVATGAVALIAFFMIPGIPDPQLHVLVPLMLIAGLIFTYEWTTQRQSGWRSLRLLRNALIALVWVLTTCLPVWWDGIPVSGTSWSFMGSQFLFVLMLTFLSDETDEKDPAQKLPVQRSSQLTTPTLFVTSLIAIIFIRWREPEFLLPILVATFTALLNRFTSVKWLRELIIDLSLALASLLTVFPYLR